MKVEQAKRPKELVAENTRLKRAVADLTVAKHIIKEIAEGNLCCKSFNGELRDELLNGELFCTLREAQMRIWRWQVYYIRFVRTVHLAVVHLPLKPFCHKR